MRPYRIVLALLLVAAIALGQLWDIVSFGEHWPWSRYDMFAGVRAGPARQRLIVYGVLADGSEVPLLAPEYLQPLDVYKLDVAFAILTGIHSPDRRIDVPASPGRVRPALADVLRRYEARRKGRRDWPALVGARLYRARELRASTLQAPAERHLLAEVGR